MAGCGHRALVGRRNSELGTMLPVVLRNVQQYFVYYYCTRIYWEKEPLGVWNLLGTTPPSEPVLDAPKRHVFDPLRDDERLERCVSWRVGRET